MISTNNYIIFKSLQKKSNNTLKKAYPLNETLNYHLSNVIAGKHLKEFQIKTLHI